MTKKQMAEAARKLDHLGMTVLWEENERLRTALRQADLYIRWYGPKGIDKDLTVKMIKEALGERCDAAGNPSAMMDNS